MSARKQKGQTSFEALGITLAVIVLATFILANFFDLKDSTQALSIIKIEAVRQLDKESGFYYIKEVEFTEIGTDINFNIVTQPSSADITMFDFNGATERIIANTKYITVNIKVNS